MLPPWDRAICLHAHHLSRPAEGILGEAGAPHRDAEQPLRAWVKVVRAAEWRNLPAIKRMFNSADILRDGRVVFDPRLRGDMDGGNKYRLVAGVNFHYGVVYVRFIGTHRQYDAIDPQTVWYTPTPRNSGRGSLQRVGFRFAVRVSGAILSPSDRAHLLRMMRQQTSSTVHRRMNVLLLLDDGWTAERIAAALFIDAETVREHRRLYVTSGISGIERPSYSGSAADLTKEQLGRLQGRHRPVLRQHRCLP